MRWDSDLGETDGGDDIELLMVTKEWFEMTLNFKS